MRTRSKLLIAALAATALLGIAVSAASATSLELTNSERGFRLAWSSFTIEAGGTTIACPLTLEGSFTASPIAKRDRTVIGRVTSGELPTASCTRGTATLLTETLPWTVQYHAFEGTLPSITGITWDTIGMSFQVNGGGILCLGRTEGNEPLRGIAQVEGGGGISEFALDESATLTTTGSVFCRFGGPAHFSGTATATVLGETALTIVRLIVEERLSPSPIDFGTHEPEELAKRTVTITAGTRAITVNRISVANGNYFAITDPNRCTGRELAERATCTFKVIFVAPEEAGREVTDTVRVETTERTLTDTVRGST